MTFEAKTWKLLGEFNHQVITSHLREYGRSSDRHTVTVSLGAHGNGNSVGTVAQPVMTAI
jgi:hypothetical protein